MYDPNPNQEDADGDDVGDECDSCKDAFNPGQEDANLNQIGDACDDGIDTDNDGIPDAHDNCPTDPNSDQADADNDGIGDECENDKDGDGIEDDKDNCPFVPNADQTDSNNNGVGDACEGDCDGDDIADEFDACPCNANIDRTDFRGIQNISYENSWDQPPPFWEFLDEGKEIIQRVNSGPGIAIGSANLAGVDFEGTIFVACCDDDWVGAIWAFQDSSKFYVLLSAMSGTGQGPWQVKRVNSVTGTVGTDLSDALRSESSVPGQTEVLWRYGGPIAKAQDYVRNYNETSDDRGQGPKNSNRQARMFTPTVTYHHDLYTLTPQPINNEGWRWQTAYRFHIHHEPKQDLINVKIFVGSEMIVDTGDIIDNSPDSLKGGRMGVYCDSQEEITWSQMSYRCLN